MKNPFEAHYDEMWKSQNLPPYLTSLIPLFDNLEISEKTRILDIACGNGTLGKFLIGKYGCRMYGTDISSVAIDASRKNGYNATLMNLDSGEEPFPQIKFDYVVLSAVLEHIMDPESMLETAYDKLAPGGKVIILMPNIQWFPNRLLFLLGRWDHRLMGGMPGHISYRNKKQLSKAVASAGFADPDWNHSVLCVAGNTDFCQKGISGLVIKRINNVRIYFWHSFLAFNFIITATKPLENHSPDESKTQ